MLRHLNWTTRAVVPLAVVAGLAVGPAAFAQCPMCSWGRPQMGYGRWQGGPSGRRAPGMMGRMPFRVARPDMVTAGDYLYVLRGSTLTQLSASDLRVLKTATLEPLRPQAWRGPTPGMRGRRPAYRPVPKSKAPGNDPATVAPDSAAPAPGGPGAPAMEPQGPQQGGGPGPDAAAPGDPPFRGRAMHRRPMMMMRRPMMRSFAQRMAPAVLTANAAHVYVLRGSTLYEFAASGLRLEKRTELPAQWRRLHAMKRPGAAWSHRGARPRTGK